MPINFDKHAQKGNKFLNDFTKELGNDANIENTGRLLVAVFHTLRDHLTVEENFKLLAQLPIALKGIYVHEWKPSKKRDVSRKKLDFIEQVLRNAEGTTLHGFADIERSTQAIHAAFSTLKQYVSQGEFNKIEAVLPTQLKKLIRESLYPKTVTLNLRKNEAAV